MKNIIKILMALLTLAAFSFTSCKKEEQGLSKAVIVSASQLTFAGQNADPQIITVYADGGWLVKDAKSLPAWLSVSPTTGTGTTDVTISVTDNIRDGALDNNRKYTLVFKGGTDASESPVVVQQEGDKYRDIPNSSVSQVIAMDDDAVVIVPDAQVAARTGAGVVLTDGTSNIYAYCDTTGIKVGDKVSVKGDKDTENTIPVLSNVDEITVKEAGVMTYPEPVEVIEIDSYAPTSSEYFMAQGLLTQNNLKLGSYGADGKFVVAPNLISINILAPDANLGVPALSGHVVTVYGYFEGIATPVINMALAKIEDNGLEDRQPIYYESWQGQSENKQKVADWSLTNMMGTGVEGVTYAAGSAVDIRWTYKQGSATGYLKYVNELWKGPDSNPYAHTGAENPDEQAAHLYAGTGTFNAAESWVEIRDIKIGRAKALKLGMGIFGVNGWETEAPAELPYTFKYKFDNETAWSLLDNVSFTGNWHWYTLRAFAVPSGASSVSFRLEPPAANYARIDDITLVEADPSEAGEEPSYLTLISEKNIEVPPAGGDFSVTIETNVSTFEHNLSDYPWITLKGVEQSDKVYTINLTAAENTGADRVAELRLYNTAESVEASVNVSQKSNAAQSLQLTSPDAFSLQREGGDIEVRFKTNSKFGYEIPDSWISIKSAVPASSPDEETVVTLNVAANNGTAVRRSTLSLYTEDKSVDTLIYVAQDMSMPTENVVFSDDFSWMRTIIDTYNAANAGKEIGDAVGLRDVGSNAPNAYTYVPDLITELGTRGYVDLNPTPKVIYPQDAYLKFGKTGYHTGIQLPKFSSLTGASDLTLSFNYCAHIKTDAAFTVDPVELFVDVAGGGTVVTSSGEAATSDAITSNQESGNKRNLYWQTATVELKGITAESTISIHPTPLQTGKDGSVVKRWYLDNIVVIKTGGGPAPAAPLDAEWQFSADDLVNYADNFGGTDGVLDNTEGFGGKFVQSNLKEGGKIEYYNTDKTTVDVDGTCKRIVGGTGHPYAVGAWPGDYWLFTGDTEGIFQAGSKFQITYLTRCSSTGHKYWMLEYYDGVDWQPAKTVETADIGGETVSYNFAQTTSDQTVDCTFTIAQPCDKAQFRMRCVANWQVNGKGELAKTNAGTVRIAGKPGTESTATTSPIFKSID